jgi:hypothetical protein
VLEVNGARYVEGIDFERLCPEEEEGRGEEEDGEPTDTAADDAATSPAR